MIAPRIVVDSNVIISGFLFGGIPARVLDAVAEGKALCFTSLPILDEVRGVLQRPKFGLSPEQALLFAEEFHLLCEVVAPDIVVHRIPDDPADDRVLECASAAKADLIVSGDSHLLDLREWKGIPIVSPADFVKSIED
jgi:putative PIN family toxin of toxin-antitoxin system